MAYQHFVATAVVLVVGAGGIGAGNALHQCDPAEAPCLPAVPMIAFTSTLATPGATTRVAQFAAAEIYLLTADGMVLRRLTFNNNLDDFPALSPNGLGQIVFETNRLRIVGAEPLNVSDLFIMKADGSEPERHLIRGASATWSPDSKFIAFHASASGTALPIKGDVGAATFDSDIFIANVDDLLEGTGVRINVTNDPGNVDDDPDWSPDGQRLAYTSHGVNDPHVNSVTAEIYTINIDGSGMTRLTFNAEEERGPDWSPDGTRIAFACRRDSPFFEICVMNADGTDQHKLTNNAVPDLSPKWSPDGTRIVFARFVTPEFAQLFTINPDGTDERRLTTIPGTNDPFPGTNVLPDWGILKIGNPLKWK